VYLVLRVCRACNHRGAAKRPSTPSHSASRHSIFFSLRARSVRADAGAPLSWGRPPSRAATIVPLFLPPLLSLSLPLLLFFIPLRRFVASRRCAHSIIIIGFRSRSACAAPRSFRFPPFRSSPHLVRLRTLAFVPNSIMLHYELTDERDRATGRGQLSPPARRNLREFIAETRANIRSRANLAEHTHPAVDVIALRSCCAFCKRLPKLIFHWSAS